MGLAPLFFRRTSSADASPGGPVGAVLQLDAGRLQSLANLVGGVEITGRSRRRTGRDLGLDVGGVATVNAGEPGLRVVLKQAQQAPPARKSAARRAHRAVAGLVQGAGRRRRASAGRVQIVEQRRTDAAIAGGRAVLIGRRQSAEGLIQSSRAFWRGPDQPSKNPRAPGNGPTTGRNVSPRPDGRRAVRGRCRNCPGIWTFSRLPR